VPFYSDEAKYLDDFSYAADPGFLIWFSEEFTDNLLNVSVPCYIEKEQRHYGPPAPIYILSARFFY